MTEFVVEVYFQNGAHHFLGVKAKDESEAARYIRSIFGDDVDVKDVYLLEDL